MLGVPAYSPLWEYSALRVAFGGGVLGPPRARRAELQGAAEDRKPQRGAARQGLEVVGVGLLGEEELLGDERAVGDRRGEDHVVVEQQRARLDADRGAGRVA